MDYGFSLPARRTTAAQRFKLEQAVATTVVVARNQVPCELHLRRVLAFCISYVHQGMDKLSGSNVLLENLLKRFRGHGQAPHFVLKLSCCSVAAVLPGRNCEAGTLGPEGFSRRQKVCAGVADGGQNRVLRFRAYVRRG